MHIKIDKKTLLDAKKGDFLAFEKILLSFEKPILNYIYRTISQKQDAEDLTQETFLKVYKNLGNINVEADFQSWVFKIATNTTYDWLRKTRNKKEISLDAPESDSLVENSLMANNIPAIEASFDITRLMEELKPIYRTILTLFYYQDFSYAEISRILSIPINTVKTHLFRAKESLQEILETQEILEKQISLATN